MGENRESYVSRDGHKIGLRGPDSVEDAEIDTSYTAIVEGFTQGDLEEVVLEGYTADYKGIKFENEYVVYWTSCC